MPTPEISVAYPLVQNITLTKDYPGYLTTEQTVNLVARVNGALQSASFTPGTRVKQGQLLFVIEPTIYKDNVTQAEAPLKTALAQLEYARNNYSRMKEALKSDAVSRIQVLQAESNVAEATAAVSNAEATLNTAHTNLGSVPLSTELSAARFTMWAAISAEPHNLSLWLRSIKTTACTPILMLPTTNGFQCYSLKTVKKRNSPKMSSCAWVRTAHKTIRPHWIIYRPMST